MQGMQQKLLPSLIVEVNKATVLGFTSYSKVISYLRDTTFALLCPNYLFRVSNQSMKLFLLLSLGCHSQKNKGSTCVILLN